MRINSNLVISGTLFTEVLSSAANTGKFLVQGSSKEIQYRTGIQLLSDIGAEPAFSKNTGFNKNFGILAGTVAEGNHTHTFASLTSKPTTLAGYGITNAALDNNVIHKTGFASETKAGELIIDSGSDDTSGLRLSRLPDITGLNRTINTVGGIQSIMNVELDSGDIYFTARTGIGTDTAFGKYNISSRVSTILNSSTGAQGDQFSKYIGDSSSFLIKLYSLPYFKKINKVTGSLSSAFGGALDSTPFTGIHAGHDGNYYFSYNKTIKIYSPSGTLIQTVGTDSEINPDIYDIVLGYDNNIYYMDRNSKRVRRMTKNGVISNLATNLTPTQMFSLEILADGSLIYSDGTLTFYRLTMAGVESVYHVASGIGGSGVQVLVADTNGTLYFPLGTKIISYVQNSKVLKTDTSGNVIRSTYLEDVEYMKSSDAYTWIKNALKPNYEFSEILSKPTTLAGYGITDSIIIGAGTNRFVPVFTGAGTLGNSVIEDKTNTSQGLRFNLGNITNNSVLNLTTGSVNGIQIKGSQTGLQDQGAGDGVNILSLMAGFTENTESYGGLRVMTDGNFLNSKLGFYTGAYFGNPILRATIKSNGNFLLNTETDNGNKFQVEGNASISSGLTVNSTNNLIANFGNTDGINDNTVIQINKNGNSGDIHFQAFGSITAAKRNIHFGGYSPSFATSETVATIDNVNKRFGIGTTSPIEKLDVNGNARFATGSSTAGDVTGSISIGGDLGRNIDGRYTTAIKSINTNSSPDFLSPRMGLFTQGPATFLPSGLMERVSILADNGNVGINVTNPLDKLTVGSTVSNNQFIRINNSGATANTALGGIKFFNSNSTGFELARIEYGLGTTNINDGTLKFYVGDSGGFSPALSILQTGASTFSDNLTLSKSDARLLGGNNAGRMIISNATTTAYIELDGSTNTQPDKVSLVSSTGSISLFTNGNERVNVLNDGSVKIGSLSGTGTRTVVASFDGTLSTAVFSSTNIGNSNLTLNSDRILDGVLNTSVGTYGLNFNNLKHFKTSAFQTGGKRAEFSLFPVGEPQKLFEIFANQDANLEGSPFLDGLTTLIRLGFYEFGGLSSSIDVHGDRIDYVSSKHIFNGTLRLKNFTVATLPAGVQGDTAYVTDALAPSYLVTVMGGGAVVTAVFFNGTTWVSH
jgi:hypothetical protein